MKYLTTINERTYTVEVLDEQRVALNGVVYEMRFTQVGDQPVYSLLMNGRSYEGLIYQDATDAASAAEEGSFNADRWQVILGGALYSAKVEDERKKRLRGQGSAVVAEGGEFHLKAPMPGLVVSVPVVEGQEVQRGDLLVVLESMKMQNELKAPRAGVVTRLKVASGERVEKKQTLLSIV